MLNDIDIAPLGQIGDTIEALVLHQPTDDKLIYMMSPSDLELLTYITSEMPGLVNIILNTRNKKKIITLCFMRNNILCRCRNTARKHSITYLEIRNYVWHCMREHGIARYVSIRGPLKQHVRFSS